MATYDLTSNIPAASALAAGDILNCPYSGAKKEIILPKGKYKLEVWGAQGGYRSSSSYGGKGGYSYGTINLNAPTTVYLYAGGHPGHTSSSAGSSTMRAGGFNGGGARYAYYGGGGGSDIRIGQDSLYARVIVAGGGGSDGAANKTGMYGGGTSGGSASQAYGTGGGGGSQSGGGTGGSSNSGSFGQGGVGLFRSNGYAGAGGGGWYGGGGSYPDGSSDDDRGGGGGSGYILTSSSAKPSGYLLGEEYYLTDAAMKAGNSSFVNYSGSTVTGNTGHGACRITVIEVIQESGGKPSTIRVKKESLLPKDYMELEYIESTGTQYIDTGYITNNRTKIIYDAAYIDVTTGSYSGTYSDKGNFLLGCNAGKFEYYLGSTALASSDAMPKERTTYFLDGPNAIAGMGDKIYPCTVAEFQNTVTNYIFILREPALTRNPSKMRLYNYKIYNSETLLHDFIPAMKISTGKIGLYDLVRKQFKTDVAGGNFLYGLKPGTKDPNILFQLNGDNLEDDSDNNRTISNDGVILSKVGKDKDKGSLYFNGSSYLRTSFSHSGDITFEGWMYQTSVSNSSYPTPFTVRQTSVRGLYTHMLSTASFCGTNSSGAWPSAASIATPVNKWYHLACVKSGTTVYGFIDGKLVCTVAGADNTQPFSGLTLGILSEKDNVVTQSSYWQGYMNNIVVTKGAKWVSDFTPPEAPQEINNWEETQEIYIKTKETDPRFEYTPLAYIEATGHHYIDTGIQVGPNSLSIDMITMPLSIENLSGNGVGFAAYGAAVADRTSAFECYGWAGSYIFDYLSGETYTATNLIANDIIRITQSDGLMSIQSGNEIEELNTMSGPPASSGCNLILCGLNRNGTKTLGSCRVYSCKIGIYTTDGFTLIRDFVPMMRNSDCAIGLLDRQHNVFYTNPNGVNFIPGFIENNDAANVLLLDGTSLENKAKESPLKVVNNTGVTLSAFGDGSMYFDGTSHLEITPYDFGNSDCTIDWWECCTVPSATAASRFSSSYITLDSGLWGGLYAFSPDGKIYASSGFSTSSPWDIANGIAVAPTKVNTWSHKALMRAGQFLVVYVDGKCLGAMNIGDTSIAFDSTFNMAIGAYRESEPNYFKGWIKNFRISKVARYTFDFTPEWNHISNPWKKIDSIYMKQDPLPEGYRRLAYLESDGTQYIDTGYIPNQDSRVAIDCIFPKTNSGSYYLFGARESSYVDNYAIQTTTDLYYSKHGTADIGLNIPSVTNRMIIEKNGYSFNVDGNPGYNTPVDYTCKRSAYIFACNSAGTIYGLCPAGTRVYGCKIYDGEGNLVKDLVPVINDNEYGADGLYDLVNNTFHVNAVCNPANGDGYFISRFAPEWIKI